MLNLAQRRALFTHLITILFIRNMQACGTAFLLDRKIALLSQWRAAPYASARTVTELSHIPRAAASSRINQTSRYIALAFPKQPVFDPVLNVSSIGVIVGTCFTVNENCFMLSKKRKSFSNPHRVLEKEYSRYL